MKYSLLLLVLSLCLLVGCDSDGGSDSTNFSNSNFTGGTSPGTPGAVPNLPNTGTATITVDSAEETIPGGITHAFTVTISGVSGFGSFIPATVAAAATGTVTGVPVTVNFGPLTQVGINTFEALGVFTGPLDGPGTIVVPINYVEGTSAAPPLNQVFTVLSSGPPPEDCGNGVDDDGDGLIDCADVIDCPLGVAPCLVPPEDCSNGIDDDGDGLIDCADPDCGASPACLGFSASSGPLGLAFTSGGGPVSDSITVPPIAPVAEVRVLVDITATFTGDLTVSLASPSATSIDLISGVGGSSDDMEIIFEDGAPPVSGFTGPGGFAAFSPASPLSTFIGEPAVGDWTLTVSTAVSAGTFDSWAIALNGDTSIF